MSEKPVCDWCGKAEEHLTTTHQRMLIDSMDGERPVQNRCCQPVAVHLPQHWTDDNKRQGRDGDVYYGDDDESDLELGERVSIGLVLAIALVAFIALVCWALPIVAQWWRAAK